MYIPSYNVSGLLHRRLAVVCDAWEAHSLFPTCNWIADFGPTGEQATESAVILRECSIDPPTCTDIDDALSLKYLSNGRYEIGVHISDVTHFVRFGAKLDLEAAQRCCTIYLTEQRFDMLPSRLSSDLCSLRAGTDRLAFSVFFEMDDSGTIYSTNFFKTVVHSVASLSYEQAQRLIDDAAHSDSELEVAKVEQQQHFDTCQLVEEFMLIANVAAAELTFRKFPSCAVLRVHETPIEERLDALRHYALAANLFTHFTSPIRRYADIMVHRLCNQLDFATSGAILLAKDARAKARCTAAFQRRAVEKEYVALLLGHVRFRPLTGRRHQLRLTACHIGHPILGDLTYGCRTP
uniref:Probable exosome complex exonuclease RRP44 n=1 Tax=Dermatophagoides pteronyssinus TaxID=6956 RepID=A0A6P6YJM3_DERPT|nr:probable exosome complex exonuclease RRP44 [Dermatophagoides pteronyssinus]